MHSQHTKSISTIQDFNKPFLQIDNNSIENDRTPVNELAGNPSNS